MKKGHDVYGRVMWAHYKGQSSQHIVERDDGHTNLISSSKLYYVGYKHWSKHQVAALEMAKGRVLDIGCGAGRHALYLQNKNYDVVGIDNSPLVIEVCKRRGLRCAKVMGIDDIGRFPPRSFDTVVLFGNNFGLLRSFHRAKGYLKKLWKLTRPGAKILTESRDIYRTSDPVHLKYHAVNRKRGRMSGQMKLRIIFGRSVGVWMEYLMVSRPEMKRVVRGTGWKVRRFLSSKGSLYVGVLGRLKRSPL